MNNQLDIGYLKGVVRRRYKGSILVFLLILVGAGALAFSLPPIFKSATKILIESQQIPEAYVQTNTSIYVEERLQMISQQVMSRPKLMGVIEQFNLYPEMLERQTTEEVLEKMREDIKLETVSTSVVDPRTGRSSAATIAFSLSYEGRNPAVVQKVASVLASLFVEEDLRAREKITSATTDFLEQEANNLKEQIRILEERISNFKKAHMGELPEHAQVSLQAISRLEGEVDQIDTKLRNLQEQKIYMQGELANVDPLVPVITSEGKVAMNPKERLKTKRLELITLQSTVTEKHPDVKRLKREIEELEQQIGESDDSVAKIRRLSELEGELAVMEAKLGPQHPDVIKLSRQVAALSKEVDALVTVRAKTEISEQKPDNPAYINLMTRVAAVDTEMQGLRRERQKFLAKIEEYHAKIEKTPVVEKEYNQLTRDYQSAKVKHDEIVAKLLTAKVAKGMEETQRGERFTIMEPAGLPEKPYKPNRIAIFLIGIVLALGASVGIAATQEAMDTSVKTSDELTGLIHAPVFTVVSLVKTKEERRAGQVKLAITALTCVGLIVVAVALFNHFVMPLDIFLAKLQRKWDIIRLSF